jgi:hypothetical protein
MYVKATVVDVLMSTLMVQIHICRVGLRLWGEIEAPERPSATKNEASLAADVNVVY